MEINNNDLSKLLNTDGRFNTSNDTDIKKFESIFLNIAGDNQIIDTPEERDLWNSIVQLFGNNKVDTEDEKNLLDLLNQEAEINKNLKIDEMKITKYVNDLHKNNFSKEEEAIINNEMVQYINAFAEHLSKGGSVYNFRFNEKEYSYLKNVIVGSIVIPDNNIKYSIDDNDEMKALNKDYINGNYEINVSFTVEGSTRNITIKIPIKNDTYKSNSKIKTVPYFEMLDKNGKFKKIDPTTLDSNGVKRFYNIYLEIAKEYFKYLRDDNPQKGDFTFAIDESFKIVSISADENNNVTVEFFDDEVLYRIIVSE